MSDTDTRPDDPLLLEVWERLRRKPIGAQALLAEIGPQLRGPLLDRVVDAGHVGRLRRRILVLVPSTSLVDGGSPRRAELLGLHRDIPWSGAVHTRGKELEAGHWGASAAGEAVLRTTPAAATSTLTAVTTLAHDR